MSAGRTPPSPWIGSTMMPQVAGPIASRTAFMLLNGTWSKPSTTGPKPSRYWALPVAASVASVRPWNAPSKQMKRKRSGLPASNIARRIILIMPSFASAPELQKNTLSANVASTSRCASRSRLRNAIQVGRVHHLGGLLGDRLDQMRMAVAQRGRGDARPEIQKSSPVHRPQPGAFAPLESEVGTGVVRQQGGDHGYATLSAVSPMDHPPATFRGGSRGSADHWRLCGSVSNGPCRLGGSMTCAGRKPCQRTAMAASRAPRIAGPPPDMAMLL